MPFTGLAIYDTGVFTTLDQDVSEFISMISPFETPLLDALSQPERSATNVLHEWLEDSLNPNTIVSSTAINTSTGDAQIAVHSGGSAVTPYLQVGAIVKNTNTGEFLQISAISGNTITLTRGFGGSTASTIAAGHSLYLISDAALEGSDVTADISRPRSRKSNYCQIFKKDIIVSGTHQAVTALGNIQDEYDYQKMQRMKETLRDLEKAVINGLSSGNTLGSASLTRTMKGLWSSIATNSSSVGVTLTPDIVDTVISAAYNNGASEDQLSLIVCDPLYKRQFDKFNESRTEVMQGGSEEGRYQRQITVYEGSYGVHRILRSRWMPSNSFMVIDPNRVKVVPLAGRSFQHIEVARTGDSKKGMVLGEYTLEVRNEEGMAKAFG
jgi:hypothetical protein